MQEITGKANVAESDQQAEYCKVDELAATDNTAEIKKAICSDSVTAVSPSPIEQVTLTVSTADDPTLPVWTFRMWFLGLASCGLLAFVNEFFQYRSEPMKISALSATLAALPMGHYMAHVLPRKTFSIPSPWGGGRPCWTFSLNPGPFNVKEHVLITIFASAGNAFGYGGAYAVQLANLMRVFYKFRITFPVALAVLLSSQMMGYGWAGLMRKHLIEPAHMWWPSTLVQVTLFRTLHEKEEKKRAMLSRSQVFFIVTVVSFAYYVIPGYFMPMLTCISILCLIWPRSVFAQQMGSGYHGLGIGAFTLDWAAISSFLGSPLVYPLPTLVNIAVGAAIVVYIVTPIAYYKGNLYKAQNFSLFSSKLFVEDGTQFNVTAALSHVSGNSHDSQGDLYLSTFFVLSVGILFASPIATITHFVLFNAKEVWQRMRNTANEEETMDVHTRMMRRYEGIPNAWFLVVLFVCLLTATLVCVIFPDQLRIPWWGMLLACGSGALWTLPIGVISATTNLTPSLAILMQFLAGYLFPGNPIANEAMKVFGHISMRQAIFFLVDFKLGHYMKIPPRSMFIVQVIGTMVAGTVDLSTAWLLTSMPHICNVDGKLPVGSPWTCPWDVVAYDTSVLWGVVGPRHQFGSFGPYPGLIFWTLAIGVISPFLLWSLQRILYNIVPRWLNSMITLINVPVILGATGWMPAAGVINYTSWFLLGFIFNFYLFSYRKHLWQRYNYVLSAGLDAGTALMGVLLTLSLGFNAKHLVWWGSQGSDHCPLASCPSSPHIHIEGCPIYAY